MQKKTDVFSDSEYVNIFLFGDTYILLPLKTPQSSL